MIPALLSAAAALLIWPTARTAVTRLVALSPPPRRTRWRPDFRLLVVLCALPVIVLFGLSGALAVALVALAGWRQCQSRRRTKSELATAKAFAEALRTAVAELRAGAPPATAAEVASADAPSEVASAMNALAGSARFGVEPPRSAGAQGQVATAWILSRKHGLPLADLLDAVRRDVVDKTRFLTRADANMAGPRASAAVLAFLPAIGVLLGEAVGARPLHVLTGTGPGQFLLVLGCALILAGVGWTSRLTRPAALR